MSDRAWVPLAALLVIVVFRMSSPDPLRVIPVEVELQGAREAVAAEGTPECFEFVAPDGFRSAGVRGVSFRNLTDGELGLFGRFSVRAGDTVLGDEGGGTLEPGEDGFGVWRAYDLALIHQQYQAGMAPAWDVAPIEGIESCRLVLRVSESR